MAYGERTVFQNNIDIRHEAFNEDSSKIIGVEFGYAEKGEEPPYVRFYDVTDGVMNQEDERPLRIREIPLSEFSPEIAEYLPTNDDGFFEGHGYDKVGERKESEPLTTVRILSDLPVSIGDGINRPVVTERIDVDDKGNILQETRKEKNEDGSMTVSIRSHGITDGIAIRTQNKDNPDKWEYKLVATREDGERRGHRAEIFEKIKGYIDKESKFDRTAIVMSDFSASVTKFENLLDKCNGDVSQLNARDTADMFIASEIIYDVVERAAGNNPTVTTMPILVDELELGGPASRTGAPLLEDTRAYFRSEEGAEKLRNNHHLHPSGNPALGITETNIRYYYQAYNGATPDMETDKHLYITALFGGSDNFVTHDGNYVGSFVENNMDNIMDAKKEEYTTYIESAKNQEIVTEYPVGSYEARFEIDEKHSPEIEKKESGENTELPQSDNRSASAPVEKPETPSGNIDTSNNTTSDRTDTQPSDVSRQENASTGSLSTKIDEAKSTLSSNVDLTPGQISQLAKEAFPLEQIASPDTCSFVLEAQGEVALLDYKEDVREFANTIIQLGEKSDKTELSNAIHKLDTIATRISDRIEKCEELLGRKLDYFESYEKERGVPKEIGELRSEINHLGRLAFTDRTGDINFRAPKDKYGIEAQLNYLKLIKNTSAEDWKAATGDEKPSFVSAKICILNVMYIREVFNLGHTLDAYSKALYEALCEKAETLISSIPDHIEKEPIKSDVSMPEDMFKLGTISVMEIIDKPDGDIASAMKEIMGEKQYTELSENLKEYMETRSADAKERVEHILDKSQDYVNSIMELSGNSEKIESAEKLGYNENNGSIAKTSNGTRMHYDPRDSFQAWSLLSATWNAYLNGASVDIKLNGREKETQNVTLAHVFVALRTFTNSDLGYTIIKYMYNGIKESWAEYREASTKDTLAYIENQVHKLGNPDNIAAEYNKYAEEAVGREEYEKASTLFEKAGDHANAKMKDEANFKAAVDIMNTGVFGYKDNRIYVPSPNDAKKASDYLDKIGNDEYRSRDESKAIYAKAGEAYLNEGRYTAALRCFNLSDERVPKQEIEAANRGAAETYFERSKNEKNTPEEKSQLLISAGRCVTKADANFRENSPVAKDIQNANKEMASSLFEKGKSETLPIAKEDAFNKALSHARLSSSDYRQDALYKDISKSMSELYKDRDPVEYAKHLRNSGETGKPMEAAELNAAKKLMSDFKNDTTSSEKDKITTADNIRRHLSNSDYKHDPSAKEMYKDLGKFYQDIDGKKSVAADCMRRGGVDRPEQEKANFEAAKEKADLINKPESNEKEKVEAATSGMRYLRGSGDSATNDEGKALYRTYADAFKDKDGNVAKGYNFEFATCSRLGGEAKTNDVEKMYAESAKENADISKDATLSKEDRLSAASKSLSSIRYSGDFAKTDDGKALSLTIADTFKGEDGYKSQYADCLHIGGVTGDDLEKANIEAAREKIENAKIDSSDDRKLRDIDSASRYLSHSGNSDETAKDRAELREQIIDVLENVNDVDGAADRLDNLGEHDRALTVQLGSDNKDIQAAIDKYSSKINDTAKTISAIDKAGDRASSEGKTDKAQTLYKAAYTMAISDGAKDIDQDQKAKIEEKLTIESKNDIVNERKDSADKSLESGHYKEATDKYSQAMDVMKNIDTKDQTQNEDDLKSKIAFSTAMDNGDYVKAAGLVEQVSDIQIDNKAEIYEKAAGQLEKEFRADPDPETRDQIKDMYEKGAEAAYEENDFQKASELFERSGSPDSNEHYMESVFKSSVASEDYDKAVQIGKEIKSDTGKVTTDDYIYALSSAVTKAEYSGDKEKSIELKSELAITEKNNGMHEEAGRHFEEIGDFYREDGNNLLAEESYKNAIHEYIETGNFGNAIDVAFVADIDDIQYSANRIERDWAETALKEYLDIDGAGKSSLYESMSDVFDAMSLHDPELTIESFSSLVCTELTGIALRESPDDIKEMAVQTFESLADLMNDPQYEDMHEEGYEYTDPVTSADIYETYIENVGLNNSLDSATPWISIEDINTQQNSDNSGGTNGSNESLNAHNEEVGVRDLTTTEDINSHNLQETTSTIDSPIETDEAGIKIPETTVDRVVAEINETDRDHNDIEPKSSDAGDVLADLKEKLETGTLDISDPETARDILDLSENKIIMLDETVKNTLADVSNNDGASTSMPDDMQQSIENAIENAENSIDNNLNDTETNNFSTDNNADQQDQGCDVENSDTTENKLDNGTDQSKGQNDTEDDVAVKEPD